MSEKDQIAELFKETFQGYEAPVRSELWTNISSQIQTPASPSVPDGSSASQIATVSGKLAGSVTTWIAGSAILVSVATGYYFFQKNDTQVNNPPATSEIPVTTQNESENSVQQPATNNQVETVIDKGVQNDAAVNNVSGNSISTQSTTPVTQSDPISVSTNSIHQNNSDSQEKTSDSQTNPVTVQEPGKNQSSNQVSAPATSEVTVPKPTITASSTSGYAPLNVTFSTNATLPVIDWNFGDGSEAGKGIQTQHTFDKPGSYLVTMKATDENGKVVTGLSRITVLSDLTISDVPNIFTPNGDGSNDVFAITTDKDIDFEVSIYTSNGRFVHKFYGKEGGWNGKINNMQDAGEGTYFYIIFATGKNGETNTQKGTITLKR